VGYGDRDWSAVQELRLDSSVLYDAIVFCSATKWEWFRYSDGTNYDQSIVHCPITMHK